MSDDKELERAARAVWEEVRQERRARRKSSSSADLTLSAERLRAFAQNLEALAVLAKQNETATSEPANHETIPAKAKPKRKRKANKSGGAKAAKKSKKS